MRLPGARMCSARWSHLRAQQSGQATTQLEQLNEVFDSLSDLVMAESVYHLVQSNTSGASAAFDSAIGQPAPDPAVVQQPRGGSSLTHRLAVVLGEDPGVLPGNNPRRESRAVSARLGRKPPGRP